MNDPICKTERNLRCGDMVVINGDYIVITGDESYLHDN